MLYFILTSPYVIHLIGEDLEAKGVEWTTIMNEECWEGRDLEEAKSNDPYEK